MLYVMERVMLRAMQQNLPQLKCLRTEPAEYK